MRRILLAVLGVVACSLLLASIARAHTVEVTVGVGDTTIRLMGWTAPRALVTFVEKGAVVGTTTADASGRYVQLLVGQMPGIHTFRIFSRDAAGRVTEAVTAPVSAAEYEETILDVFLPPAVTTSIEAGALVIEGSTAPGATVVITIGSRYYTVKAGSDGTWRYAVPASSLPADRYSVQVAAFLPGGLQSHGLVLRTPATLVESSGGGSFRRPLDAQADDWQQDKAVSVLQPAEWGQSGLSLDENSQVNGMPLIRHDAQRDKIKLMSFILAGFAVFALSFAIWWHAKVHNRHK